MQRDYAQNWSPGYEHETSVSDTIITRFDWLIMYRTE